MTLITFETFQAISFTLAASLFLYLVVAWFSWFISELRPKKPSRGLPFNLHR